MARGDDQDTTTPVPRRNPFRQKILSPDEISKADEGNGASQDHKPSPSSPATSYPERVSYFAKQSYPQAKKTRGRIRENLQGLQDLQEALPILELHSGSQDLERDIIYLRGFLFALWNQEGPSQYSLEHLRLTPEDKTYALKAHERLLAAGIASSLLTQDSELSEKITYALSAIALELERAVWPSWTQG